MHLALYRSERPERLDEIIGQKHIVKILRNQIREGTPSQTYLFTGTRGTGKTTTARILAKAVNCIGTDDPNEMPCGHCENCRAIAEGNYIDVVELDAASNNKVEDIRAIVDHVQYPPTLGRYKVYIIDEVHMLTAAAQNAFLKTLEEPPSYAIFILATTNPEEIRQTIKSRCMTLNFKRVSEDDLVSGMRRICGRKGVSVDDEALAVLARKADGSVRDALSLLEQCLYLDDHVTADLVLESIGSAGGDFFRALTEDVVQGDLAGAFEQIDRMIRSGKDAKQLLLDWLEHYRNLMIAHYVEHPEELLSCSEENAARIRAQALEVGSKRIAEGVTLLSEYVNRARQALNSRILLETAAVRLAEGIRQTYPVQGGSGKPARAPQLQKPQRSAALTTRMTAKPEASVKTTPDAPSRDEAKRAALAALKQAAHHDSDTDEFDYIADSEEDREPTPTEIGEAQPLFDPPAAPREGTEDRHIGETEGYGDLDELWAQITREMGRRTMSFASLIGNHSRLIDYTNDELTVLIKKNKLSFAEKMKDEITEVARSICGERTFVSFQGGSIVDLPPRGEMTHDEDDRKTERIRREDVDADELAGDLEKMFHVEVTMK